MSPAGAAGEYLFRTTFDIPATVNLSDYSLVGRWTADNRALGISLNGGAFQFANLNPESYTEWTPFLFLSGFVHGLNILDFKVVNDDNGFPGNPVGLRVEFVPEPRSNFFVAFGLISLWLGARRLADSKP